MEPQQQQNGEVAEDSGCIDDKLEVRTEAMQFEGNGRGEASTSECGGQGEDGVFSPRVDGINEESKRESGNASPRTEKDEGGRNQEPKRDSSTSSPRAEWRKEQVSPTEGSRTGSSKGKGSKGAGRGGKNVGKESGRNSREGNQKEKISETIRAAGLPSMRRTKSQPGRSRGGGEREEVPEEQKEPVLEKDEDRPSGEVTPNWAAVVKQWFEKQEPAMLAVRDYVLQLRARVEFRVKRHWPLVRAWLLLIMKVMLMLSLRG